MRLRRGSELREGEAFSQALSMAGNSFHIIFTNYAAEECWDEDVKHKRNLINPYQISIFLISYR